MFVLWMLLCISDGKILPLMMNSFWRLLYPSDCKSFTFPYSFQIPLLLIIFFNNHCVKVVICGSFYPNYFLSGEIDERDSRKTMSGHDPFTTIMVGCLFICFLKCVYDTKPYIFLHKRSPKTVMDFLLNNDVLISWAIELFLKCNLDNLWSFMSYHKSSIVKLC